MKIYSPFTRLAQRAGTVAIAVGLAVAVSFSAVGLSAQAAEPAAPAAPFKIDPAVQAKSLTEAPALIALAKVNCDPVNAYLLGGTEIAKDGAKVKGQLYEVACKTGPGFIVTSISPTEVGQAFTCSLAAKLQATNPTSIVCVLPENKPHYKWLTPVVQPYLPGCVISDARVIGSTSAEPLIDRYEIGCGTSPGGVIDYPQLGSSASVEYKSCLVVDGTSSACQYTTKEQMMAPLKAVAAKAAPACQVNNARFVGVTKENDGYYYEFGCANQAGFIALTGTNNSYVRTVPCASAAGLGGCTFTNAGEAAKDANGTFTAQLAKGGLPCTVEDYNVIGTQAQTKRDFIEFKCKERPWGLIGFVPQSDSTASLRMNDCFIDQANRKDCTFVTESALRAQLDKLIKVKEPNKGCDVSNVRYVGESDGLENALIAEVACANKRGYIVIVAPDRNSIVESTACKIAKSHKDPIQCEIPGNGTYAAAD